MQAARKSNAPRITLTIPQQMARNNREVRNRRRLRKLNRAVAFVIVAAIYIICALGIALLVGGGW